MTSTDDFRPLLQPLAVDPTLRERLELVGGTLEVESSPGGGTTVIARVPLSGRAGVS